MAQYNFGPSEYPDPFVPDEEFRRRMYGERKTDPNALTLPGTQTIASVMRDTLVPRCNLLIFAVEVHAERVRNGEADTKREALFNSLVRMREECESALKLLELA